MFVSKAAVVGVDEIVLVVGAMDVLKIARVWMRARAVGAGQFEAGYGSGGGVVSADVAGEALILISVT